MKAKPVCWRAALKTPCSRRSCSSTRLGRPVSASRVARYSARSSARLRLVTLVEVPVMRSARPVSSRCVTLPREWTQIHSPEAFGHAVLAVELLAHALHGVAERRREHFAIVGMVPLHHLVARERRLARRRAEQRRPALVEVHLVVPQVPVPQREARAGEREVEALLGARHLLLGALAQRDVARHADHVGAIADAQRLAAQARRGARCPRDRRSRPRAPSRAPARTPRASRARRARGRAARRNRAGSWCRSRRRCSRSPP